MNNNTTSSSRKKTLRSSIHLLLMSVLAFIIGFLMSYDAATMHDNTWDVDDVDGSITTDAAAAAINSAAPEKEDAPSTTLELLGRIALRQRQLNNEIIKEYGMYGKNIFNKLNVEKILQVSPLSQKRLIRKIMMKILLGRIKSQEVNNDGGITKELPLFRWVAAGDSSAAGYGNAWSQSYTSILQSTVSGIFKAAGIQFVASNRAGDVYSGIELAFCTKEIFGLDVDAISWDFMPLDTNHFDPLSNSQGLDPLLFGERVGMTYPQLPFLYFFGAAISSEVQQKLGSSLENRGVGIGTMTETSLREVVLTFPSGNDKRGGNQPEVVSKFHCNGAIEGIEACDDVTQMHRCYSNEGSECRAYKYAVSRACANDDYQTPWNAGHKMHRLKGRLLGYHLMEMLRLATLELDSLELKEPHLKNSPAEALELLRNDEEVEGFLFSKTSSATPTEESSWDWLKLKKSTCLNAMSVVQQNGKSTGPLPIELHPRKESVCNEFLPFQNAFFRTSEREQLIPGLELSDQDTNNGVMYGVCIHASDCDEEDDECEIDPEEGNPITVELVQILVDGTLVSELKHIGGCHFLANEDGLNWSKELGGEGVVIIRTSKAFFISSLFAIY